MDGWNSLVEATIYAIHIDPNRKEIRIEVKCAWEGLDRKQIVATGVDDFVVNEMRLSNIIDRVSRFNVSDVKNESAEIARCLFFLMRGIEPSPSDLKWPPLLKKLAQVYEGTLCLLEIEPVFGARILILAEDFRLESVL